MQMYYSQADVLVIFMYCILHYLTTYFSKHGLE